MLFSQSINDLQKRIVVTGLVVALIEYPITF